MAAFVPPAIASYEQLFRRAELAPPTGGACSGLGQCSHTEGVEGGEHAISHRADAFRKLIEACFYDG